MAQAQDTTNGQDTGRGYVLRVDGGDVGTRQALRRAGARAVKGRTLPAEAVPEAVADVLGRYAQAAAKAAQDAERGGDTADVIGVAMRAAAVAEGDAGRIRRGWQDTGPDTRPETCRATVASAWREDMRATLRAVPVDVRAGEGRTFPGGPGDMPDTGDLRPGDRVTVSAAYLHALQDVARYVRERVPSADVATVMAGHHLQHVRTLAGNVTRAEAAEAERAANARPGA